MLRAAVASLYFASLLAVLTSALTIPALLLAPFDRSGRAANGLVRLWARLLLRLAGVRVEVLGADRLPPGPAVYAANHASALDIPVVFGALPIDFRIVYKQSLRLVPFLGWALTAGRHVSIDRSNPFRARRSLKDAAQRIAAGTSVVVFPEGTRATGGALLPFKRGSFQLAIEAGVRVVPLSLRGVKRLIPRGLGSLRPGRVEIVVHEPIETRGLDPGAAAALADRVRGIVEKGLEAVNCHSGS